MFAKNLRYLRKKQGYSQENLADMLGYKSFTTIQKWESEASEPTMRTLKQLSKIFHVSMDDLVNQDISSPLYQASDHNHSSESDNMTLGEKLKKLRKEQNKTQQEVADIVGVAKSTYSLYESDKRKPNVLILKKLARVFDTTGDYLLSLAEDIINKDYILTDEDGLNVIVEQYPNNNGDDTFQRFFKIFQALDDNSKKELLSYAEFKKQAYQIDPDLKDAENAAAEYIEECDDEDSDDKEKSTPDQPEKIG